MHKEKKICWNRNIKNQREEDKKYNRLLRKIKAWFVRSLYKWK